MAVTPDTRFKGVISLDGASENLSRSELARVRVPSLIVDQPVANYPLLGVWPVYGLRPHAFIGARTSYRVDINHATHWTFSDGCAALDIETRAGVFPNERMPQEVIDFLKSDMCTCPTGALPNGECVIDAQLGHDLMAKYMLAFINA